MKIGIFWGLKYFTNLGKYDGAWTTVLSCKWTSTSMVEGEKEPLKMCVLVALGVPLELLTWICSHLPGIKIRQISSQKIGYSTFTENPFYCFFQEMFAMHLKSKTFNLSSGFFQQQRQHQQFYIITGFMTTWNIFLSNISYISLSLWIKLYDLYSGLKIRNKPHDSHFGML